MCKPLRKVKKTVTTLTFLMLVIFLLPIAASAADTGDEKITSDDFAVEISDETSKILESMGIENIDYDARYCAVNSGCRGSSRQLRPIKNRRKIFGRYCMLFSDSFCFDGASCEHPFVCGIVDCADG